MYNHAISFDGRPGETFTMTAANTAQYLTAAKLNWNGDTRQPAIGALVTIETNSIRFTHGGATPTDSFGHVLTAGSVYKINSPDAVRDFRFCNDTAGSNGVLMVTPYF